MPESNATIYYILLSSGAASIWWHHFNITWGSSSPGLPRKRKTFTANSPAYAHLTVRIHHQKIYIIQLNWLQVCDWFPIFEPLFFYDEFLYEMLIQFCTMWSGDDLFNHTLKILRNGCCLLLWIYACIFSSMLTLGTGYCNQPGYGAPGTFWAWRK